MNIIFDIKGKQYTYDPAKRDSIIIIDYRKELKKGDKIIFDKILTDGKNFGQPYLKNFHLEAEVLLHSQAAKITGMKYKAKKRNKRS